MIAYVRDHYCVRTGLLSCTYGIMIAYVRDHYCVRTGYIAYVRDHDSVRTGSLLRTYGIIIAYVRDNDCVRTESLLRTYGILPLYFFLPMSPLGLRTISTWSLIYMDHPAVTNTVNPHDSPHLLATKRKLLITFLKILTI